MALFGEKCVRCGERRTRSTHEGLPTCAPCQQALEASARAASEETRICPVDAVGMSKEVILGIVIDRCSQCNGVWLDGGELDLIRGAVAEGIAMDLAKAMTFPG